MCFIYVYFWNHEMCNPILTKRILNKEVGYLYSIWKHFSKFFFLIFSMCNDFFDKLYMYIYECIWMFCYSLDFQFSFFFYPVIVRYDDMVGLLLFVTLFMSNAYMANEYKQ